MPDSHGVVHTCYSKKTGNVRVLKSAKSKCSKKKERALNLNQKGRSGAQGPRGPRGPVGPSNAFVVHPDNTQQNVTTTAKTVASLSLPAGSFAVFASVRVASLGTATNADCQLSAPGTTSLATGNVNVGGSGDRKLIPLNDALVLGSPASLDLVCEVTVGAAFGVDEIRISAIKVGAASVQGP